MTCEHGEPCLPEGCSLTFFNTGQLLPDGNSGPGYGYFHASEKPEICILNLLPFYLSVAVADYVVGPFFSPPCLMPLHGLMGGVYSPSH